MDCWIGVVQEADRCLVRLAGRLGVAQVPDLIRVCGVRGDHLQLDLTDLVSADTAGIEALQRVRASGALLVGVPGYIQLSRHAGVARRVSRQSSVVSRQSIRGHGVRRSVAGL